MRGHSNYYYGTVFATNRVMESDSGHDWGVKKGVKKGVVKRVIYKGLKGDAVMMKMLKVGKEKGVGCRPMF